MDIDEALDLVGGYRRWHVAMFITLGISAFMPLAWQGLSGVFIGWEPPHHCYVEQGRQVNQSIPWKMVDGRVQFDKCRKYSRSPEIYNETTSCNGSWTYNSDGYFTAVQQWDLVCEHNYLFDLSQSFQMVASLVADILTSYMIDKFGRKLMHVTSHVIISIVGISIAFSNGYVMFVVLRCIMGILIVGNVSSGLTMCLELFDAKRRTFAGIGLEFQWVALYLSLPLMAYFITDWRTLQIVISVSSIVWILLFWTLPESLIWLTAAGRYDEAEEILGKIARWNGVDVPSEKLRLRRPGESIDARRVSRIHIHRESIFYAISPETINTELANIAVPMNVPVRTLFTDRCMVKHILICSLHWFANNLVYYGLIMSSAALAGNRFLNFLIMGFVELPAIFVALYTTEKFGRRISTVFYHVAAGVPLGIVMFIPEKVGSSGVDLKPLYITLVMVSKFFISASFAIIVLYCKELFPTNLRATSSGLYQILGRIGSICAPFAYYASKTSLHWLPNVVCGLVSICAGIATLWLPETSGRRLPESLSDVYDLYKPPPSAPSPNQPPTTTTAAAARNSAKQDAGRRLSDLSDRSDEVQEDTGV